jgi:hypothetical protein
MFEVGTVLEASDWMPDSRVGAAEGGGGGGKALEGRDWMLEAGIGAVSDGRRDGVGGGS